jgi:hypothetical protein
LFWLAFWNEASGNACGVAGAEVAKGGWTSKVLNSTGFLGSYGVKVFICCMNTHCVDQKQRKNEVGKCLSQVQPTGSVWIWKTLETEVLPWQTERMEGRPCQDRRVGWDWVPHEVPGFVWT